MTRSSRIFLVAVLIAGTFGCIKSPQVNVPYAMNGSTSEAAININTASVEELTRIPHVGEKVASKIIEHREQNGPFRRVEHLMLIQGISDKRFRKIRPLVKVE